MLLDHTSGVFNVGDEGDIVSRYHRVGRPRVAVLRLPAGGTRSLPAKRVSMSTVCSSRSPRPMSGISNRVLAITTATSTTSSQQWRCRSDRFADWRAAAPRLVEPLGLRHTTIAPDDLSSPEMHGYGVDADDGSLVDLTDDFLALGNGGGGGVISTADELLTIMQAIASGRCSPTPLVEDMKARHRAVRRVVRTRSRHVLLSCGTFYGHGGAVSGTIRSLSSAPMARPGWSSPSTSARTSNPTLSPSPNPSSATDTALDFAPLPLWATVRLAPRLTSRRRLLFGLWVQRGRSISLAAHHPITLGPTSMRCPRL